MKNEVEDSESLAYGIDDIFGMCNCIKIASNLDGFSTWLKLEHNKGISSTIFDGYTFFMMSAIRTLINAILNSLGLGFEEDIVLRRASFDGIQLNKVPNTCTKTLLVKNINDKLKRLRGARNIDAFREALEEFKKEVLYYFDDIFSNNVAVNRKFVMSKDEALRYITMLYTYIFLNDTSRGIPSGYYVSILGNSPVFERGGTSNNFEGYKYALQYVWASLLGKDYYSTSMKNLHTTKDWVSCMPLEDRTFEETVTKVKRGEDLDSYFGKVRDEIILPLEKRLKVDLFSRILVLKHNIPEKVIKSLANYHKEPQLSKKEYLDFQLLWYSKIEFLETSKHYVFNGVPVFIDLLTGIVEHKKSMGIDDKSYVCKFVHPDIESGGNDYSYGVLIESYGTFGSDYSGWLIFFDCCGDYSGFGGGNHAMAERLIDLYLAKDLIELREMILSKDELESFTANKNTRDIQYLHSPERKAKKEFDTIVSQAKGLTMELLTYYILTSSGNYLKVAWDTRIDGQQYDLIAEKQDELMLIECISKPDNMITDDEIKKLKEKMECIKTTKKKGCKLFFWHRPSQKTLDKLGDIEFELLPNLVSKNGKKLDKFNVIFNYKL